MQLNEIHNPQEHASVSLKVILLVFAVILVGVLGYLVWDFKTAPDTTDYSSTTVKKTETTETEEADETVGWKTFDSSILGTSFKYPSTLGVYTLDGQGPDSKPIIATSSSSYIFVSKGSENGGKLYLDDYSDMKTLTKETISSRFIDIPSELIITSTKVNNLSGYKVVIDDESVVSNFYFIENGGKIIKITVPKNDTEANNIFETLEFAN